MPLPPLLLAKVGLAAEDHSLPVLLLLSCVYGESSGNVRAERWGKQTEAAKVALAQNPIDRPALRRIIRAAGPPNNPSGSDVSFGLCQRSAYWAPENPDHVIDLDVYLELRERYFDPDYALRDGAARLAEIWPQFAPGPNVDLTTAVFKTLCYYNRPASKGEPANEDVAADYRRAIALATADLTAVTPIPGPLPLPPPVPPDKYDGLAPKDRALLDCWQAFAPIAGHGAGESGTGLYKAWRNGLRNRRAKEGPLGVPVGPEHPAPGGHVYQAFSSGIVLHWDPSKGALEE